MTSARSGGGCSDDSFIDFRAGVTSLGREWYERVAAAPDSLAEHPVVAEAVQAHRDEALFCEDFDFDDAEEMRRRLPHLARLCLGPNT
ncbi:DUF4240 domain-containing protein [Streptomyces sp. WAC08241]|uniref:DUF4240 domain-containing protein n=1 Tax=Streptomyces sp. WAC08241 TaxID=2487421 RepID=UPI0028AA2FB7|nr:DUF4240 domain-containing protein [Streptomyces sp. WAC08241]